MDSKEPTLLNQTGDAYDLGHDAAIMEVMKLMHNYKGAFIQVKFWEVFRKEVEELKIKKSS